MQNRETVGDDSEKKPKTSIRIMRGASRDVTIKAKQIMKYIEDPTNEANKLDFTYADWSHFVVADWHDKIWIAAINKAIKMMMRKGYDLNINEKFLDLMYERSFPELKEELDKMHPIANLAFKDAIDKKMVKPEPRRKYEDLWLNPDQLRKKYGETQSN